MRQAPLNLQTLIGPVVVTMGYELLGVEYIAGGKGHLLRLYIDRDSGITLDDCVRVNRQVSGLLDVEDPLHGSYAIEVSSPGLDRPLFTAEQFARFTGYTIRFRLLTPIDGRRKFTGVIKAVDGDVITIGVDNKELELSIDRFEKANLIPQI